MRLNDIDLYVPIRKKYGLTERKCRSGAFILCNNICVSDWVLTWLNTVIPPGSVAMIQV